MLRALGMSGGCITILIALYAMAAGCVGDSAPDSEPRSEDAAQPVDAAAAIDAPIEEEASEDASPLPPCDPNKPFDAPRRVPIKLKSDAATARLSWDEL